MKATSSRRERAALRQLASAWGVQTAYVDATGRRRVAATDALIAVLRALGSPLETLADAPEALRHRKAERASRSLAPVLVAPDGRLPALEVRLARAPTGRPAATLELEQGGTMIEPLSEDGRRGDRAGLTVRLRCGRRLELPMGAHELRLETGGTASIRAHVLAAPRRCWSGAPERRLALFAPLYALHSRHSWGLGDLTDLERLAAWSRSLGVDLVAVLPLLAGFFDRPFDPSPYSPATRLFWNELYLDPRMAPELESCPQAVRLLDNDTFVAELDRLRRESQVGYRAAMRLKRQVLELLARAAFESPSRRAEIEDFSRREPHLEEYARFRATVARQGRPWPEWPQRLRQGELRPGDWDEEAQRYHLYVQSLCDRSLQKLNREQAGLYLDVPLGVSGQGFDVWRFRAHFARGAAAGSPPDGFFAAGQNWGFPPPHPHSARHDGHAYFRKSLRAHLRRAAMVRLDHVMALHRLFWIPEGFEAKQGVYVRYPARELYAALAIESHRHRCRIVGENLGTVPAEVDRALRRYDLLPMHILQFELSGRTGQPFPQVRPRTLAGLNTHDMAPFAAFWGGKDIALRRQVGLLDGEEAAEEQSDRAALRRRVLAALEREGWLGESQEARDTLAVLRALLCRLAAGDAEVLVVQLEDLWAETEPQNVPGVVDEIPPWRRKMRRSLESIVNDASLAELFAELARLRSPGRSP